jgi:tetratricopeptide (TPR) repeat protein
MEVPGPDGTGVATLEDAMSDPAVLERMNLPGQSPYGTSLASLVGSPTKIGILLDSSRGYFSPKMKLLQSELGGEYRTNLFREPAEQRDHFAYVLGRNAGEIKLWSLPFEVEARLFNDGQFVASIQQSLFLFKREYPLIYARVKQLRGDLEGATNEYVKLRFKENAPLINNKNLSIGKEVQAGLDAYATYYLALAHLEKAMLEDRPPDRAAELFENTLKLLPEPGPSRPYYHMLRWGANANLGRIYEAKKDGARAIAYETRPDPTTQGHGNLVRARELVFRSPIAAPPVTISPSAEPRPMTAAPANPAPGPGPVRAPKGGN